MSHSLIDPLILELNAQMKDDRITREHLKAFLEKPDRVFDDKREDSERLFALLPKGLGEDVRAPRFIDGKLFYQADEGGRTFVWGGQKFPVGVGAHHVTIVGGMILYIVDSDGVRSVVWGGHALQINKWVWNISIVDEKPLYVVSDNDQSRVVWGEWLSDEFDEICNLSVVDEKPLYVVSDNDQSRVVWGEWESKQYEVVFGDSVSVADGKPMFIVEQDDRFFIVRGEEEREVSLHDYCTGPLTIADGKPLYIASYSGGVGPSRYYVWGDRKYEAWDSCSELRSIVDGKLLYVASNDEGKRFVVWDEKEYKVTGEVMHLEAREDCIVVYSRRGRRILALNIPR